MQVNSYHKVIPAVAGLPLVHISDWIFTLATAIPIPQTIEDSFVAVLTGLGVLAIPNTVKEV